MKKFIFLLFLVSCVGESPLSTKKKLEGNWDMVEYQVDGAIINEGEKFTNTAISFWYDGVSQSYGPWGSRNQNPCNQPFPVMASLSDNGIYFNVFTLCDTLNLIDPYYYETPDTANNGISGSWDFESFTNRRFIMHNTNYSRKKDIRVTFEKKL